MEKSHRHSRKREAILKVMRETKSHPCAEWVYQRLKPEYPELSLGTVYRNIAKFQEAGEVSHIATVSGLERYDADTSNHAHFICNRCGDITDIDLELDDELKKAAGEATGAQIDSIRLSFEGLCPNCISNERKTHNKT